MADYPEENYNAEEMEDDPDDGWSDNVSVSSLDRLYQHSISENSFIRQMVGRSVVEILRNVHDTPTDVEKVMSIVERTAKDTEPAVKGELMEHLPHIVMVCHELGLPNLSSIVNRLLPSVMETITDSDKQVQKTAQTALLVLMEQNLISEQYMEDQICPRIVSLTYCEDQSDLMASATAWVGLQLMSKMAPLLGVDITEQLFVPRLLTLCSHPVVVIRQACASNFGDFCAVVTRQVTETLLLPKFCELARDSDWNVRKACAEVIMSVSCACCLQTRKAILAPVFASLLSDVMRWVRTTAFQTLGPFITTFAEPSITDLAYNQQGELVLTNPEGFEFRLLGQKSEHSNNTIDVFYDSLLSKKLSSATSDDGVSDEWDCQSSGDSQFNSFLYWREPLPEVDLDLLDLVENSSPIKSEIPSKDVSAVLDESADDVVLCSHLASRQLDISCTVLECDSPEPEASQDIVPQPLIDHFVSMCHRNNSTLEIDLAHHCAFSLPAVALTLGPAHWDLLRDTYTTLASDRMWKVRRTVASSIHELAVIIGEEVATQDLVPIFNGLIKDLDEVRIGALRHLAHFLKLLRPSGRFQFLPKFADFLKTEYDYNWRFREELATQLLASLCLFSPSDTFKHLTPVAVSLLLDHVAAVRLTALDLVKELVNHVAPDVSLLRGLLAELAEQFAHSARWNRRQTFALLCSKLVSECVLSDEMFARDVLPHLLDLSWDPVPNVRLAVARTLSTHIMANEYFCNDQNPHHEVLVLALRRLQSDKDRDVRYFASVRAADREEAVEPNRTRDLNELRSLCYTQR